MKKKNENYEFKTKKLKSTSFYYMSLLLAVFNSCYVSHLYSKSDVSIGTKWKHYHQMTLFFIIYPKAVHFI